MDVLKSGRGDGWEKKIQAERNLPWEAQESCPAVTPLKPAPCRRAGGSLH